MFAGLFSYGDFNQISRRLAHFPVLYLVAALALAALNYCLRYLRWSYYLQVLKIRVPFRVSSLVFLSGLAMSITPGKMGEFLKSYLLRDRCQVPIAASAPVVLMERLTDVTPVILLGLIGLFLLPLSVALLLAVLMLLSGGALFLITSRHSDGLFRLPVLRKWQGQTRYWRWACYWEAQGWQSGGLHRHSPGPIGDPVVRRDRRLVRHGLVGQAQDRTAQSVEQ